MNSNVGSADNQYGVAPQKEGRFTLRELCVLVCLVSFAGACVSWMIAGSKMAAVGGFLLPFTVLVTIGFVIRMLTKWSILAVALTTFLLLFGPFLLLAPFAVMGTRAESRQSSCRNNMSNIALALVQYHDSQGCFPPPYIADEDGQPMHSWRVLLLPYLDQRQLYKQYRFDEPWDGPNNSQLHSQIVRVFNCPSNTGASTDTSYVAVVGPRTMWPPQGYVRMVDITDGTSNTVMLVEVRNSGIHWMEPRDLDASQMAVLVNGRKGPSISSGHKKGVNVAFADGSVRLLSVETLETTLRGGLTRADKPKLGDF